MGPRPTPDTESRATTKTRRSVAAALAGAAVLGAGCLGGGDDTTPTADDGDDGAGDGDGQVAQGTPPATPEAGCSDDNAIVYIETGIDPGAENAIAAAKEADENGDGWVCKVTDEPRVRDNGDSDTSVSYTPSG
jgi:hypothetical protein